MDHNLISIVQIFMMMRNSIVSKFRLFCRHILAEFNMTLYVLSMSTFFFRVSNISSIGGRPGTKNGQLTYKLTES